MIFAASDNGTWMLNVLCGIGERIPSQPKAPPTLFSFGLWPYKAGQRPWLLKHNVTLRLAKDLPPRKHAKPTKQNRYLTICSYYLLFLRVAMSYSNQTDSPQTGWICLIKSDIQASQRAFQEKASRQFEKIVNDDIMRTFKLFLVLVCLTELTYSQTSDDLVIAKGIKVYSKVLGEDRIIYVSTPNGYNDSKDSYQVMYPCTLR
eukprot:TRINITY_DN23877_c0_g1_i1.p1 TRINITY_DN23877_c0_g1~~TRINITY_DN23877_c0_g1_i1.p1  ORF type:complete len:204 (-),score=-17.22 TRINITY_DN23877_c0_g1_i1:5-616(-)